MNKKLSLQKETIYNLGGSSVTALPQRETPHGTYAPTLHVDSSIHISTTIWTIA